LTNILFLDPNLASMRAYSYLADKQLFEDGRNLSAVLYHLWNDEGEGEANQSRILSFIASLPEQDITAVSFLRGPKGEVLVELTESFGGTDEVCDASLLSDGTLRVLAIAAIMLSAPEGSLVVIEEIGNGIHPSRAHHLLAEINQIARDRNLRILISTHNPALLNALPIESIGDVVFCYRDPLSGSSKLTRLQDLPDYPELISRASLGDLLTTGLLEKFVKTYEGPEAKKEQALAWLASMSKG
jgi:predicted ATPase